MIRAEVIHQVFERGAPRESDGYSMVAVIILCAHRSAGVMDRGWSGLNGRSTLFIPNTQIILCLLNFTQRKEGLVGLLHMAELIA